MTMPLAFAVSVRTDDDRIKPAVFAAIDLSPAVFTHLTMARNAYAEEQVDILVTWLVGHLVRENERYGQVACTGRVDTPEERALMHEVLGHISAAANRAIKASGHPYLAVRKLTAHKCVYVIKISH